MEPRIETLEEKKLIGKRLTMSLAGDKTYALWSSFMPRRKEIHNKIGIELYCLQVYDPSYFDAFMPEREFEKWAAVEVTDFDTVPDEMEPFLLPAGQYAVFFYKGPNTDTSIFQYIYGAWLPNSDYLVDNRPHFQIMGEKYKNNDPSSEEEIWVPIKSKE